MISVPVNARHLALAPDGEMFPVDEDTFYLLLGQFLQGAGAGYKGSAIKTYVTPDNKLRINASRLLLLQAFTNTTDDEINALTELYEITAATRLMAGRCLPYSVAYPFVEANKAIREELYRNLGLAFVCVAVITLPLISSFLTCLTVLITVMLTVVDVAGGMYYLDTTINIVSSIALILRIGLSIDYSAHVGHAFMTVSGSRNERVRATLETIGAPVFLDAFSTFLAISPVVIAESFVLRTFFKIFTRVVALGLFHGLALLPVLLSLVGPPPYQRTHQHTAMDPNQIQPETRWWQQTHWGHSRKDHLGDLPHHQARHHSEHLKGKTKIFYVHPRLEYPVPCYNGRPAMRPTPGRRRAIHLPLSREK